MESVTIKYMRIYFSGIGGVGLGPLAEIARDAGYSVTGSDAHESLTTRELVAGGITLSLDQTGEFLAAQHEQQPIDWFIYTAALPDNHPELERARMLGIRTGKRDELLSTIIEEKGLKLIAVAGTHGKTSTTALMTWVMKQLSVPVSYSIGAPVGFGPSGMYDDQSQYFVYECDEFDRNFLHFSPHLTLLTSVDYDHPDTYPTQADYAEAFTQFLGQSGHTIMWQHNTVIRIQPPAGSRLLDDAEIMNREIALQGEHNRANATLVYEACKYLEFGTPNTILAAINSFPGTARRFEKLADNLYTDYGHHPVEIRATLQMARELSDHVVLVYQPHQNTRQHQVRATYISCMEDAEKIYWLPTYLSRENPELDVLTPQQLTERLTNKEALQFAQLDDALWQAITQHRASGHLVLCMGAGDIDAWVRSRLT